MPGGLAGISGGGKDAARDDKLFGSDPASQLTSDVDVGFCWTSSKVLPPLSVAQSMRLMKMVTQASVDMERDDMKQSMDAPTTADIPLAASSAPPAGDSSSPFKAAVEGPDAKATSQDMLTAKEEIIWGKNGRNTSPEPPPLFKNSAAAKTKHQLMLEAKARTEADHKAAKEAGLDPHKYNLRSLGCMRLGNPLRIKTIKMVEQPWFDRFILAVIFINTGFLAAFDPLDVPTVHPESSARDTLEIASLVFTYIFLFEFGAKCIAYGFYFGKKSYLSSSWNWLDFGIVVISLLDFLPGSAASNLSAIRTFRVMRPLRAITKFKNLRFLVRLLLQCIPMLMNVVGLCFFIFFVFGILGVQLWAGLLRSRCYSHEDGTILDHDFVCSKSGGFQTCPENYECMPLHLNPKHGVLHFDNIMGAVLTIFQVMTYEGWAENMYTVEDAWSPIAVAYFVLLIFVGPVFAVQLFLVVISTQFAETKQTQATLEKDWKVGVEGVPGAHYGAVAEEMKEHANPWVRYGKRFLRWCKRTLKAGVAAVARRFQWVDDTHWFKAYSRGRVRLAEIMTGKLVGNTIVAVIVVNTLFMAMEHDCDIAGSSSCKNFKLGMEYANLGFSAIFAIEMILKMVGLGPSLYFSDTYNAFDFLIVIFSLIELEGVILMADCLNSQTGEAAALCEESGGSSGLSVLRTFRLVRIVKLLRAFPALQRQLMIVAATLSSVSALLVLISLFLAIFAILGMNVFGGMWNPIHEGTVILGSRIVLTIPNVEPLWHGRISKIDETQASGAFYHVDLLFPLPETGEESLWATIPDDIANNPPFPLIVGYVPRANYDRLITAVMTTFQILTQEDWQMVMYTASRTNGMWCSLYFMALIVFGNYMLLNLFIAIIIQGFAEEPGSREFDGNEDDDEDDEVKLTRFQRAKQAIGGKFGKMKNGLRRRRGKAVNDDVIAMNGPELKTVPSARSAAISRLSMHSVDQESAQEGSGADGSRPSSAGMLRVDSEASNDTTLKTSVDDNDDGFKQSRPKSLVLPNQEQEQKFDPATMQPKTVEEWEELRRQQAASHMALYLQPKDEKQMDKFFAADATAVHDVDDLFSADGDVWGDETPRKPSSGNLLGGGAGPHTPNGTMSPLTPMSGEMWNASPRQATWRTVAVANLDGVSLFCLDKYSGLRAATYAMVSRQAFDNVILFCILLSSVSLAMERPGIYGFEKTFLGWLNTSLNIAFLLECFLKVTTFSFVIYIKSGWNQLDFFIVTMSIVDEVSSLLNSGGGGLSALRILRIFRIFRALRPLRVISRARGLRIVVMSITGSVKPILNTIFIAGMVFLIFGILGVQLLSGKMHYCSDTNVYEMVNCKGFMLDGTLRVWRNQLVNFDHIGEAILTMFTMASLDGWPNVMWAGVDATSKRTGPKEGHNEALLLYFVCSLLIAAFLVINIFVGVFVDNYNTASEKVNASLKMKDRKRRKVTLVSDLNGGAELEVGEEAAVVAPRHRLQDFFQKVVSQTAFDLFIAACIALNVITMAFESYKQSAWQEEFLATSNYLFTYIFAIEAIMKLVAFHAKRYFRDGWNKFDYTIVMISFIGIAVEEAGTAVGLNPTILRVLRVFRIFRILRAFRIFKAAKGLQAIVDTLGKSLPAVGNLGGLMFLLFFIYGILAVQLFGPLCTTTGYREMEDRCKIIRDDDLLDMHASFANIAMALLTLFRVATGDAWGDVMQSCKLMMGPREDGAIDLAKIAFDAGNYERVWELLPGCQSESELIDLGISCPFEDLGICHTNCGQPYVAPVFFATFVAIANFVLLNLVIAVLMQQLADAEHKSSFTDDMVTETLPRATLARIYWRWRANARVYTVRNGMPIPRSLNAMGMPVMGGGGVLTMADGQQVMPDVDHAHQLVVQRVVDAVMGPAGAVGVEISDMPTTLGGGTLNPTKQTAQTSVASVDTRGSNGNTGVRATGPANGIAPLGGSSSAKSNGNGPFGVPASINSVGTVTRPAQFPPPGGGDNVIPQSKLQAFDRSSGSLPGGGQLKDVFHE